MNANSEPLRERSVVCQTADFAALFREHYPRIARVLARIVEDPSRAEELAADVFWKLLRNPNAPGSNSGAWLYRVAVRKGIDELRRRRRREKYEPLMRPGETSSPEDLHGVVQNQQQVRTVLAALKRRDSELLILRSEGLAYEEIAPVLQVSSTSIGTLLRRAQEAFRREYVRRYGQPNT